jgi:hypothetical protein
MGVCLCLWTASASAHSPQTQPTDPNANSPAGVMYAIPLDSARQDAAPHGHTGAQGGTAGSGSGGSGASAAPAESGSSSAGSAGSTSSASVSVTAHGASSGSNRSGEPVLVPGGQPGSLIHSSDGFGSSPLVPGTPGSSTAGNLAAVQSDSGSAPTLAILLAVFVIAIGGYAGARAWRGLRQPPLSSS